MTVEGVTITETDIEALKQTWQRIVAIANRRFVAWVEARGNRSPVGSGPVSFTLDEDGDDVRGQWYDGVDTDYQSIPIAVLALDNKAFAERLLVEEEIAAARRAAAVLRARMARETEERRQYERLRERFEKGTRS